MLQGASRIVIFLCIGLIEVVYGLWTVAVVPLDG